MYCAKWSDRLSRTCAPWCHLCGKALGPEPRERLWAGERADSKGATVRYVGTALLPLLTAPVTQLHRPAKPTDSYTGTKFFKSKKSDLLEEALSGTL